MNNRPNVVIIYNIAIFLFNMNTIVFYYELILINVKLKLFIYPSEICVNEQREAIINDSSNGSSDLTN